MPLPKLLLFLCIISIPNFALAQKDLPILAKISVQNAFTEEPVFGVRIIVEELHSYNNSVINADSIGGTLVISKYLIPKHKYRLRVRKDGYYPKDTVIIPQFASGGRQQKIVLSLFPKLCFYLSGKVLDASNSTKIIRGKIRIQNLTNPELLVLNLQNGQYKFCGKCNHQYQLSSIVNGFINKTEIIELSSSNCFTATPQSMKLDFAAAHNYDKTFLEGGTIVVPNFTFIGNTRSLSIQGEQEVKRLVQFLKQEPKLLISIAVQAAAFPEQQLNRKLAELRARLIEQRLRNGGIAAHRYLLICKGSVDRAYSATNKKQQIRLCLRK